ncbi:hypothetical protein [Ruminococcus sp.]|nr:hypothetical protein [Ruminococcus sp.]
MENYGTEIDGLNYVLARKVFRKFEALNLSYIRDEIDGLLILTSCSVKRI